MQDLGSNSSRIISVSEGSESLWIRFLTSLGFGPKPGNFTVTQFGNFTTNFEKLPPPIPDEYLIPLYGIIVSSIVGWSIPSIISGINTKRQERRLYSIHNKIDKLYDNGRLDSEDIKPLEDLLSEARDAYSKGKINNERFTNLKTEISVLYEEIFKKRISKKYSKRDSAVNCEGGIERIKEEIGDAYAKGKLIESHYDLLNKMTSDYEDNT